MTTFICFIIAMIFLYIIKLFTGTGSIIELLSVLIMTVLLGSHVYLSTRKKVIYGIIIPALIVGSFYPVYKLIEPAGSDIFLFIGLYVISLGASIGVWYKARKNINNDN